MSKAPQVHVIPAAWQEHKDVLRHIREVVFIQGQSVPRELEWDGLDEDSQHFLAVNELGQYIGCARLLDNGQIGRMAVLEEYRGSGIGAQLLDAAIEAGRERGLERLFLHAQSYAEAFYRKGGFVPYGEPFEEADIPHIAMEMKLPLTFTPSFTEAEPAARPAPAVRPQQPQQANGPSKPQTFDSLETLLAQLQQVTRSARRKLHILHPNLDQEIFEHAEFLDSVSALARSAPRAEIQILILDSKLIVDRGHQLLELARRLDEKIKIRRLQERANTDTSSFVCADTSAYWLLPNWEQFDGVTDLYNPVTCSRLLEAFRQAWEKSVEDPELRLMHL